MGIITAGFVFIIIFNVLLAAGITLSYSNHYNFAMACLFGAVLWCIMAFTKIALFFLM